MFQLVFTETYLKREKKFLKKYPDLIPTYKKVLKLLEIDPAHPSLRLHKLKGKFQNKYSMSITMSFRIILTFAKVGNEIILIDIGPHNDIY